MSGIGHNNPPADRTFKRRWAAAIFACPDKNKPGGAVAMAFRLYHDMDGSGRGVAVADLEIASACGVSDRSVRTFKGWLVKAGFVKVLARGGRGGQTEYQACIPDDIQPADISGQIENKPEPITGNNQLNRQSIPAIENGLPAKIADQNIQPAAVAGQIAPSCAVVINNNINNNNNLDNMSISEKLAASAREGGTVEIGAGVIVNCRTIAHKDFKIEFDAIELHTLGRVPMDEIRLSSAGYALDWAGQIADGKHPRDVLPKNGITNWIAKSFHYKKLDNEVNDVRKAKVSARQVPREKGKSFSEMTAELMKEIDQEQRR